MDCGEEWSSLAWIGTERGLPERDADHPPANSCAGPWRKQGAVSEVGSGQLGEWALWAWIQLSRPVEGGTCHGAAAHVSRGHLWWQTCAQRTWLWHPCLSHAGDQLACSQESQPGSCPQLQGTGKKPAHTGLVAVVPGSRCFHVPQGTRPWDPPWAPLSWRWQQEQVRCGQESCNTAALWPGRGSPGETRFPPGREV